MCVLERTTAKMRSEPLTRTAPSPLADQQFLHHRPAPPLCNPDERNLCVWEAPPLLWLYCDH